MNDLSGKRNEESENKRTVHFFLTLTQKNKVRLQYIFGASWCHDLLRTHWKVVNILRYLYRSWKSQLVLAIMVLRVRVSKVVLEPLSWFLIGNHSRANSGAFVINRGYRRDLIICIFSFLGNMLNIKREDIVMTWLSPFQIVMSKVGT